MWVSFFQSLPALATALPACRQGRRYMIAATTPLATLQLGLALLYRGGVPIFGTSHDPDIELLAWPQDYRSTADATIDPAQVWQRCLAYQGTVLGFATSGSTGSPQIIMKEWAPLLAESETMKQLFLAAHKEPRPILALVPPWHLYGFLFGFLLPVLAKVEVNWALPVRGVLTIPEAGKWHLLVLVPALWQLLEEHNLWQRTTYVLSSGASLGAARQREFLATGSAVRVLEIFGSSETGGIAWRQLDQHAEGEYELFSGVQLECLGAVTIVRSPHCSQAQELADQFEQRDNRIVHLGRSDRVFKWGAKRFALPQIEAALQRASGVGMVQAYFISQPDLPQGGILAAALIGTLARSITEVLRAYSQDSDLPLPKWCHQFSETDLGPSGKLSLEAFIARSADLVPSLSRPR